MWGGTQSPIRTVNDKGISIHPPRVGRDSCWRCKPRSAPYFNPPSPCGEGHRRDRWQLRHLRHFNPPSPCGEGPDLPMVVFSPLAISIHPPRVGRDRHPVPKRCRRWSFQSTLPVWGGTIVVIALAVILWISIHPPRVGRDPCRFQTATG